MLLAVLALLGVDLIVIVAFGAFVLARRRWVMRQPGAFRGAIRVNSGKVDGLGSKWGRGYGRWVRNVLVWTKAPLLLRNELVPTDALSEQRPARTDEVKRVGDHPIVIRLDAGQATVELAATGDDRQQLLGPYHQPHG